MRQKWAPPPPPKKKENVNSEKLIEISVQKCIGMAGETVRLKKVVQTKPDHPNIQ